MKLKLIILPTLSLLITNIAQADLSAKPQKCPSVSAIQAVGVNEAISDFYGRWWVGIRKSTFDTQNKWSFGIHDIVAEDKQDALNKASKILLTLKYYDGPTPYVFNSWLCTYISGYDYLALAITPAS